MPLVRIDLRKGKDASYRQQVGRVVYEAMVSVGVPTNDRFQIVAEHEEHERKEGFEALGDRGAMSGRDGQNAPPDS